MGSVILLFPSVQTKSPREWASSYCYNQEQWVKQATQTILNKTEIIWFSLSSDVQNFLIKFRWSIDGIYFSPQLIKSQKALVDKWERDQIITWVSDPSQQSQAMNHPALWKVLYERIMYNPSNPN